MLTSIFIMGSTTGYTLLHIFCYGILVHASAKWGIFIGRDWLWSLPTMAMLFEFLPLLNTVQYVASGFLFVSLALGLTSPNLVTRQRSGERKAESRNQNTLERQRQEKAYRGTRAAGVGLCTDAAIKDGIDAQNGITAPAESPKTASALN